MVIRDKVVIPPLTGNEDRTSYVYLPAGYNKNQDRRYPVIYMFDGHNLFTDEEATYGKCWGLKDYLDNTKTQVIIAAVECNHKGDSRLSEYSPVSFDFYGKRIVGRGKKYMDWLVGSFKPQIDATYRTMADRAHTFIAGSSMGGLMTIYALAKYGKYFKGGAALSPSLWVEDGPLPEFIEKGAFRKDAVLYASYGAKEFDNHFPQRELFGRAYAALCAKNVAVTARITPDGRHCEASWEKEIPFFMQILGF